MNSLTYKGEEYAFLGGAADGGIARLATAILLYHSSSVPAKTGTYGAIGAAGVDFFEIASGNGYTTGGIAVAAANWTGSIVSGYYRITLTDQIWTASGGVISNVAGALLIDTDDNVLAWWERAAVSISAGEDITLDDLYLTFAAVA